MKRFTYLLLIALMTFAGQAVMAQKIGYLNSGLLLSEHPDIKVADSELETMQQQFASRIQQKLEGMQTKYADLKTKEAEGNITPKDLADQVRKLQEQEVELQKEEQQLQTDLLKKREQLYQPILDKINAAIESVAKNNGYSYIIDQSQGALIYADETLSVMDLVKAELGM